MRRSPPRVARSRRASKNAAASATLMLLHVDDAAPVDREQQRLRLQPPAVAGRAEAVAAVAGQEDAHVHLVGAALEPAEPAADAVVLALAVDDQRRCCSAQLVERRRQSESSCLRQKREQLAALPLGRRRAPRLDGAVGERLARIGDDEVEVDVDDAPEAAAGLAGAERAVEGEQVRRRLAVGDVAARALEALAVRLARGVLVGEDQRQPSLAEAERLLERIGDAPLLRRRARRGGRRRRSAATAAARVEPPRCAQRLVARPAARRKPEAIKPARASAHGRFSGSGSAKVTSTRVPSGAAAVALHTDSAVSRCTGWPHWRQCRTPILANSSFRWSCSSVIVPTVERDVLTELPWLMAIAGRMPSMRSTCGLSMRSRNCRV